MHFRKATGAEASEIKVLVDMEYSDLEADFGKRIGQLDDTRTPIEAAKQWLLQKRAELVELICVEGNYCEFINNHKNSKPIDVIASLADCIAKAYGSLPVYHIATILVRQGLDRFCDC